MRAVRTRCRCGRDRSRGDRCRNRYGRRRRNRGRCGRCLWTRNYRRGVAGGRHLALALPGGSGQCRQPVLLALPVQGIHALRFQGNGGVLEVRELVHQHGPLCPGLGHGLTLGVAGTLGVELAGLRSPRGLVGGPVGVCGGSRQRLGGDGCGLCRLEGPRAAGGHGLKGGGLLQGVAGPGDKAAQGRIQSAAAVEIAGELADLLARLLLLLAGCRGPGGGNRGGVTPELQFHKRFAVGVIGLQGGCEAGILRGGGVRQEPVDRGDLRRRRGFTGLGRGNLIRRWNPRRSRDLNSRDLNSLDLDGRGRCGVRGSRQNSQEHDGGA